MGPNLEVEGAVPVLEGVLEPHNVGVGEEQVKPRLREYESLRVIDAATSFKLEAASV